MAVQSFDGEHNMGHLWGDVLALYFVVGAAEKGREDPDRELRRRHDRPGPEVAEREEGPPPEQTSRYQQKMIVTDPPSQDMGHDQADKPYRACDRYEGCNHHRGRAQDSDPESLEVYAPTRRQLFAGQQEILAALL